MSEKRIFTTISVNIITLGCSKNLVDSEKLLRQMEANGFLPFHNSDEYTDIVIINTCGFILDAKSESIETILSYADAKNKGLIRKLIVTGCLSQRYGETLKSEIPEVDAYFGVNQEPEMIRSLGGNYHTGLLHERTLTTPSHYAFLKIAEGCNRNCSFCTIPSIRGKQISNQIDNIMKEAEFLVNKGVKEILLIAQDLTSYGTDLYRERSLGKLLNELVTINGLEWIKLHYAYPLGFPSHEIAAIMNSSPKICKYLDIPIQHINDRILRAMNRGHGRKEIEDIVTYLRQEVPDIAIRTTIISGFPGETVSEYEELKTYLSETRFERLGVFSYSEEEGTAAADKMEDDVPAEIKEARKEELLSIQQNISLDLNIHKIGKTFKVIIDREEGEFFAGRTQYDSPEIDNEVLVPKSGNEMLPGHFYDVIITDAMEFDLFGEVKAGLVI